MDEKLKAFLLLNSIGADLRAWNKFCAAEAAPSALWKDTERFAGTLLTANAAGRLVEAEKNKWAEKEYDRCAASGATLIAYGSDSYPKALCDLKDAPLILYFKGSTTAVSGKTVGVVGTRRATSYGKQVAYNVGNRAASENTQVISGGAAGIDGQAHSGCCNADGTTFAVLGTGVDVVYPFSNKELFERIKEKGALISEFPLGTQGEAWHFPRRNRIVAALSKRIVVAEAPEKSGAIITARLGLELGREIWAVPGRITESTSGGTNKLIFDGAYPLISLDAFFGRKAVQIDFENLQETASQFPELNETQKKILKTIAEENDLTVDNIAVLSGISAGETLKTVSLLAAFGLIETSAPGRYVLSRNR